MYLLRNIKCYVCHPIPYKCPSLSIDHQTVTIMNHCCYYFDSPWKGKALFVIIMPRTHFRVNIHSLNISLSYYAISEVSVNTVQISTHNASQSFDRLALSISWMVCYQSVPGGVQGMIFCEYEREVPLEKNVTQNICR